MTTQEASPKSTPSATFTARFFGISGTLSLASAISQIIDFIQSGKYSALLWTSAFIALFVVSLAALAWRHAVGRLLERLSGSDQPRQWLWPAIAILVVILVVLWSGLVVAGVIDRQWKGRDENSPIVSGVISQKLSPGLPWIDTFDGSQLEPNKWRPSPLPDVIHVRDGKLRFDVNLSSSDPAISRAELEPILPGWPIGQVDVTISAQQTSGVFDGGVTLFIQQESGTTTGVGFGPSKKGPGIDPWICRKKKCGPDYNDYSHPEDKEVLLNSGQPTMVHIAQTGQRVEVQAGGISFSANDDPSPILDVRFRLDADKTDHWTAAVDDLKLTPAAR